MKMTAIAMILTASAGVANAQQVNPQTVRNCFAAAGPGVTAPSCLGQASNTCQAQGHDTTIGISACIQAETAVWDTLLNETYKRVRSELRARGGALPDQLLAAQRAWITYRDAECALDYARWGDGSIRTIVGANCMMLETAERALELRDKLGN